MIKKVLLSLAGALLLLFLFTLIPETTDTLKSQHFTFIYSSTIPKSSILEISTALEGSYNRISTHLKTKPAPNIETYIYDSRWRYVKATGWLGASGNIEGPSKQHFIEESVRGAEGNKLAVHEFTHAVLLQSLIDKEPKSISREAFDKKFAMFPVWLWEGISAYEANELTDPKTLRYLTHETYPSLSELNNRKEGGKIYTSGYTIIEYILTKYGHHKLIDLIDNYGDIQKTLGVKEEQFSKDWYAFVTEKYL